MHRLQTRAQFQAVLAGTTVSKTAHFAMHCCAVGLSTDGEVPPLFAPAGIWLGAMVPKRWAKRAVTRNTIKRQIYQLGGQFAPALKDKAHLVRLRRDFDRKHFVSATSDALKAAVREELLELFGNIVGNLPPLPAARRGAVPAPAGPAPPERAETAA
ncbi:ribonuclease P protein component [Rhodoferax sp. OV413]|uniref:ribonuclease P protein component n=1 Tax=Rhodoferax sp. OV413 TaxID=1855285 RepID=UPI0025ED1BE5|nr:ribonuclease P protein component [Rhodoferax sp. OV413]